MKKLLYCLVAVAAFAGLIKLTLLSREDFDRKADALTVYDRYGAAYWLVTCGPTGITTVKHSFTWAEARERFPNDHEKLDVFAAGCR